MAIKQKNIKHKASELDAVANLAIPKDGSPTLSQEQIGNMKQGLGVTDLELKVGDRTIWRNKAKLFNKSQLVISNGKISSVSSSSYRIAYIVADNDGEYCIEIEHKRDFGGIGSFFIANSEDEIAVGNTVTVLKNIPLGESGEYIAELEGGQCLCVACYYNTPFKPASDDVVVGYNCIPIVDELSILGESTSSWEVGEKSKKTLLYVNNSNVLTTAGSERFNVSYIKASAQSKYKVNIEHKVTYTGIGKIFVVNSEAEIAVGTTVGVVKEVPLGESGEYIAELEIGQCLCVACSYNSPLKMPDDIVSFSMLIPVSEKCERIEAKLPINNPTEYTGRDISVFNKIVCIGDSLTAGYFNIDGDRTGFPQAELSQKYSYPSILHKISGAEVVNLGESGITSSGWYEKYAENQNLVGCDCAIIQLCVNDKIQSLDDDTSKAALKNIIALLKNKNKGIIIFLAGIINAKSYKAESAVDEYYSKDQMIRDLYEAEYKTDKQVFFIDHVKYGHLSQLESNNGLYDNYNQGHLSAYGYCRLAQDYANYISWIMATDRYNRFGNIQFTGTDYKYKL